MTQNGSRAIFFVGLKNVFLDAIKLALETEFFRTTEGHMLMDWVTLLGNLRSAGKKFAGVNPITVAAYKSLNDAQSSGTALDPKTRELIAVAVAVTTRCDGCISSHIDAAKKAGVSREELSEALGMAIALNAGAAYVYSIRAMEAYGQFEVS
jgi:AhpD family alkylhydroperoxidase